MDERNFLVGIDVGGTFTDYFVIDTASGRQLIYKSPTTPDDLSRGVLRGLTEIAQSLEVEPDVFFSSIPLIVHGTTVTTNAVLTERGAKTALITTEGFRDVLQMRRGVRSREHLYDNKYIPPEPLVAREHRIGVRERTTLGGKVLVPIDEQEMERVASRLRDTDVEAVAICFMHSYANPHNERVAGQILRKALPGVRISTSASVAPMVRLYERVSTTAMNAYVGPVLQRYLDHILHRLEEAGFAGELLIMQSNGGVTGPENAATVSASTVLSGPAAGPIAGGAFARAYGVDSCVVVDMGGISYDASIVQNGRAQIATSGEINRHHIALPMVAIHTIGAGGGSIAWVDDGGLLRVGPQSAGADPGPVCYGRGGVQPAVSDADLVLGYLNPDYFLGGRMPLDLHAARSAILERVARPLHLSVEEAAFGIYQIVNLNMANGIKEITIHNGYDPREFPLVVAGGAGPIHAAFIAKELGIREILIPQFASVLCATGMLASDLRHDYVRSCYQPWHEVQLGEVENLLRPFYSEGEAALAREGIVSDAAIFTVGMDLRYVGQHYEVTVEFPFEWLRMPKQNDVHDLFLVEHERLYGYQLEGHPVELMNVRLTCLGRRSAFSLQSPSMVPNAMLPEMGQRKVFDPVRMEFTDAAVINGDRMVAGQEVTGCAVVESSTTTIMVPDGYTLQLGIHGNFVLKSEG